MKLFTISHFSRRSSISLIIGHHCTWPYPSLLISTAHDWIHWPALHMIISHYTTWSYLPLNWPALHMIISTIGQHHIWLYPPLASTAHVFIHHRPALPMIESTIVQHCTWPYPALYSTSHHIHYWPALYMIESIDQHCTWPYLSLTLNPSYPL